MSGDGPDGGRILAWRYRRLSKGHEVLTVTSEAFIHMAMVESPTPILPAWVHGGRSSWSFNAGESHGYPPGPQRDGDHHRQGGMAGIR